MFEFHDVRNYRVKTLVRKSQSGKLQTTSYERKSNILSHFESSQLFTHQQFINCFCDLLLLQVTIRKCKEVLHFKREVNIANFIRYGESRTSKW